MRFKTANRAIWLAILGSGAAQAGTIYPAEFSGQPLIYQREGKIHGCGVRVVGVSDFSSENDVVRVVDSSFVLYAEGMSLIKAGISTTTGASISSAKPNIKPVRPASFWMRHEGGNPTSPREGKVLRSPEDPNFLLYAIPAKAFASLSEVIYGEVELQVGVRPEKGSIDWVLSGKLSMSEADIRRFHECVQTVVSNMDEREAPR